MKPNKIYGLGKKNKTTLGFLVKRNAKKLTRPTLIFFLILSSIGVFLVYLIVTSVPQINGYYNRGLASLFVCFSIIIALFNEINFKKKKSYCCPFQFFFQI